jgi:hypothetical protein
MKFKTSKKAIMNGYSNVICVSYCGLQSLLNRKSETAYTTRREGWAADIYEITPSTAICTGYAPFGNIRPGYEICNKYETAAEKIRYDYSIDWDEQTKQLDELLKEFIKEVTQ